MKDSRLEALLVATNPQKTARTNKKFTDDVMRSVERSEIISSHIRTMNMNKKKTFTMKLKHLPKLAVVAIALGAGLVLSAGTYAAYYLLWPEPKVEVTQQQNTDGGRTALAISFDQCGDKTLGNRYELKRNATISQEDVPHIAKARCELSLITQWAEKNLPYNNISGRGSSDGKPYESSMLNISFATHIKTRTDNSITFAGLEKYNAPDKTIALSSNVQYIAGGKEVAASDITTEDPIVYITRETELMTPEQDCTPQHCNIDSKHQKSELLAVVKLGSDLKYYDQLAWQSLTERVACQGNENDTCATGYIGGILVYDSHGSTQVTESTIMKVIQGTVTKIEGRSVTIKGSSGTLYTVVTDTDVIGAYNRNKSADYQHQKVGVGTTLNITYAEASSEHNKTIPGASILSIYLQTEAVSKGDTPALY